MEFNNATAKVRGTDEAAWLGKKMSDIVLEGGMLRDPMRWAR